MKKFIKNLLIATIPALLVAGIAYATVHFDPAFEGSGTPTSGYLLQANGAGTAASWVATSGSGLTDIPTSTTLYVNVTLGNDSTGTGTIAKPYQHISAAVAAGNALGTSYTLQVSPGAYTDTSATTPTQPMYIHGNGASYTINSGNGTWTLSNGFTIYDLNVIGNVSQTNTSLSVINNLFNSMVSGNLTVLGYLNTFETEDTGNGFANSVITVGSVSNSTAFLIAQNCTFGAQATNYYTKVVNWGAFWQLDTDVFANDNSSYAVDSSAAGSSFTGSTLLIMNAGTGGGLNLANGATTNPNEAVNLEVFVNGTTNAITCGTAYTYLDVYKTFNSNTGSTVAITCSNLQTSYYGPITANSVTSLGSVTGTDVYSGNLSSVYLRTSNDFIYEGGGTNTQNPELALAPKSILLNYQTLATGTDNGGNIEFDAQNSGSGGSALGGNLIFAAGSSASGTPGAYEYYDPTRNYIGTESYSGISAGRTYTHPDVSGTYTLNSATQTLTNKRITHREVPISYNANPTYTLDNGDIFLITTTGAISSMTTNQTYTSKNEGDAFMFEFQDAGSPETIAWGTNFESDNNVTCPTTTLGNSTIPLRVLAIYNSTASKLDCIAVN